MAVFWYVAPCSLVYVNRRFIGAYCLHHQVPDYVSSSETSVSNYYTILRNIPEDRYLHTCRRENLQSHQAISSAWLLQDKTFPSTGVLLVFSAYSRGLPETPISLRPLPLFDITPFKRCARAALRHSKKAPGRRPGQHWLDYIPTTVYCFIDRVKCYWYIKTKPCSILLYVWERESHAL
jgi:hypothetical protein